MLSDAFKKIHKPLTLLLVERILFAKDCARIDDEGDTSVLLSDVSFDL